MTRGALANSARPAAILTDIEGTTTPIAFVRDTLFPFARARLAGFVRDHGDEPPVRAALEAAFDRCRQDAAVHA